MNNNTRISLKSLATLTLAASLLAMGGCSNLSHRDRNTISGATIGAVAGAALTGGSPLGTVGGAAVGGIIGSEISGQRR